MQILVYFHRSQVAVSEKGLQKHYSSSLGLLGFKDVWYDYNIISQKRLVTLLTSSQTFGNRSSSPLIKIPSSIPDYF